jgi:hypothetical protein
LGEFGEVTFVIDDLVPAGLSETISEHFSSVEEEDDDGDNQSQNGRPQHSLHRPEPNGAAGIVLGGKVLLERECSCGDDGDSVLNNVSQNTGNASLQEESEYAEYDRQR